MVLMSARYAEVELPEVRLVPKPFSAERLLRVVAMALRDSRDQRPGARAISSSAAPP